MRKWGVGSHGWQILTSESILRPAVPLDLNEAPVYGLVEIRVDGQASRQVNCSVCRPLHGTFLPKNRNYIDGSPNFCYVYNHSKSLAILVKNGPYFVEPRCLVLHVHEGGALSIETSESRLHWLDVSKIFRRASFVGEQGLEY